MRIFLFKTGGLGDNYGIGSYISSIITASKNHLINIQFIIINLDVTSKIEQVTLTKKKNITYCKIPTTFNGINIYNDSLFPNAIYATLCDLFNLNKKDVFHFNASMQFLLAKKIKEELSPNIIYTVHILMWKSIYQSRDRFLTEFKNKTLSNKLISIHRERDICKISKKVICMNSETVDYINSIYRIDKKKILTIPNGLPENPYDEIIDSTHAIREKFGLLNKKIILFVGRVDHEKGIFDLIEVFKKLTLQIKEVKLIIIGDGAISHALSLCNGIWNDVLFTGYIKSRIQLKEFYRIADIMVLTSYHEQSSFTFLEGIQNRKPLILSEIPAFEKIKEDSCRKVNFIKKSGTDRLVINKKKLLGELLSLLKNEDKSKEMAENAFKTFKSEFNLDTLYDILICNAYNAKKRA